MTASTPSVDYASVDLKAVPGAEGLPHRGPMALRVRIMGPGVEMTHELAV